MDYFIEYSNMVCIGQTFESPELAIAGMEKEKRDNYSNELDYCPPYELVYYFDYQKNTIVFYTYCRPYDGKMDESCYAVRILKHLEDGTYEFTGAFADFELKEPSNKQDDMFYNYFTNISTNDGVKSISFLYLEKDNNIPWIIGFSGGKDSTVVLTLVWRALLSIREEFGDAALTRQVYVVNNDTLVENPIITDYIVEVMDSIRIAAIEQKLPLKVQTTVPKLEDSFWISFLGKGYPVPNNTFRWCTDRLKIKPTTQFILDKVDAMGEAVVLIGTRLTESATRAKSIRRHEIKGKRLTKHPLNPNTYTYPPIKDLYLEEVWYILNNEPSPWGYDNKKLFQIYADATADDYECPTVITDKTQPSCGQSRFGCWVCTVVKEDKSMMALINNGNQWMAPLLKYRDEMVAGRNISENRYATRRNGQVAQDADGHNQGNYTFEYRCEMLRKLLELQRDMQKVKPHMELISNQELVAIQINWYRDGFFAPKVTDIYNEVYKRSMPLENMQYQERLILEKVCAEHPEDYHLINDLVSLQKSKTILMNNNGLQGDIEKRLDNYLNQQ